ncbi:tRNA-uridine aminocarboxypropyltransferase [Actimicrobium sp. CCI2.3]|uniref:tRNA-uridine aminocarboxypropyltransferase n=1 Tax=Actimicrobium sp. CCI2.3 TaxID=3048616 RepID=UPI002AB55389|nr:tRNA-uridine aminocarboxypropyltransferase [Actimicrobium sp. CCI2.3]MDY7574966.1 tRNA-uridine aminocarboxypropyltransferase [Actimicrobium sp. CCI2.3]MEB0021463.1 tRNA-uridine aminocarboxypropyltransferase [Actimicrobium sp. CCI2.3]
MKSELPARRAHCARCLRPQTTCICAWITPVTVSTEVVILQHPLETDNAKGSARLLQLSLSGSQLVQGETFTEAQWQTLLADRHTVLLYPDQPGSPASPSLAGTDLMRLRVIVLDGTWRKSRKMLFRDPRLQQLPRLTLQDAPASHYHIRKAQRADQLSTLEATCHALLQLGEPAGELQHLLQAFDGFVTRQARYKIDHQK